MLSSNGPQADDYRRMTQEEHVLARTELYVGDPLPDPTETWIFVGDKIARHTINISRALERIFLEVLSNASDNVGRSRRAGVDVGKISIEMNQELIRVRNEGLPIPIEMHTETGIIVPELIFGHMLTSSNYQENRHEAGVNGIGAKATNILSRYFSVYVEDSIRHLSYRKTWFNNKSGTTDAVIEQFPGDKSSVVIEFSPDFQRFSLTPFNGTEGGFPMEYFCLFARHALDTSFNAKVPVLFNGVEYHCTDARAYGRFYFGDAVDSGLLHYEWPAGTKIVKKSKGVQEAEDPNVVPLVEMIVIDTPDEGTLVSFVNCMMTEEGGIHVNDAIKVVSEEVLEKINATTEKKLKKGADASKAKKYKLTLADVKPHVSLILSVRVKNPRFSSASKTKLLSPKVPYAIDPDELKIISRWKLADRLFATLEAKEEKALRGTDGKKRRHVNLDKGRDANFAGTPQSPQCILVITEGNSGAGYANAMVKLIPNGTDFIGVLPMRGKALNVRDCPRTQLELNVEFNELKKALGLREGTIYDAETARKDLRYGQVLIAADSDVDGKHIIGLIANYFDVRFRSLLLGGFVRYLRTPILRARKGKECHCFLTAGQYEEWVKVTPDHQKWSTFYYKGLGTSKDQDVEEDLKDPFHVVMVYDEGAEKNLQLAFDKDFRDARKKWIFDHSDVVVPLERIEPITQFINADLIEYSIANVQRSIPNMMDGLKESQRKIIHYLISHYKGSSAKKVIKVAQLGAATASETNYHHGEGNLDHVIIKMAQRFVGTNNIPLLKDEGQFGSRLDGGKDASHGRYLYTEPENIFWKIFRTEDLPILNYITEEGMQIEPETFYPIIPNILVNGATAIATGFSTFIPNHNPLDIISWLMLRLSGKTPDEIACPTPWYQGFTGEIEVKVSNSRSEDEIRDELFEDELENPEMQDFFDTNRSKYSMVMRGKYTTKYVGRSENLVVEIVELPIGVWPHRYAKFLNLLREEKKIKDFSNKCAGDKVHFIVEGFGKAPALREIKLERTYGISNMVVLDEKRNPIIFQHAAHLLEIFYQKRLPIYEKRKAHELAEIEKRIINLHHKKNLIDLFLNNRERFINVPKAEVRAFVEANQIPYEIYNNMKLQSITSDDIRKAMEKIVKETEKYRVLWETDTKVIWYQELQELSQALTRSHTGTETSEK